MSACDKGGRRENRIVKKIGKRKNEQTNGDVVFIVMIWPRGTTTLEKVTLLRDFPQTVSYNTGILFMWVSYNIIYKVRFGFRVVSV